MFSGCCLHNLRSFLNCDEELSFLDLLPETSIFAQFRQFLIFRKFCEFLEIILQHVSPVLMMLSSVIWCLRRHSQSAPPMIHRSHIIRIQFVSQICNCFVDTELIDRNHRVKNQVNGFFTSVVVSDFLSTTFTFQFSSSQEAGGLKSWMPALSEIDHHDLGNSVPFTMWLV